MIDIRWSPLARRDIVRIEAYHLPHDPDLADRLGRQIISAATLLREHPMAGPLALDGKRRKRRVIGTRYNLFYRIYQEHVRILRVLHDAQDQAIN